MLLLKRLIISSYFLPRVSTMKKMPKSAFNKLINPKVIIVVKRPNDSKNTGNIDPRMNEMIQIIETESEIQVCLIFFGNISAKE